MRHRHPRRYKPEVMKVLWMKTSYASAPAPILAMSSFRTAIYSATASTSAGRLEGFLTRHDDAVAIGKKAIESTPSYSLARASLAMSENYVGHSEGAITLQQRQFA
jgi:hypothetical protein